MACEASYDLTECETMRFRGCCSQPYSTFSFFYLSFSFYTYFLLFFLFYLSISSFFSFFLSSSSFFSSFFLFFSFSFSFSSFFFFLSLSFFSFISHLFSLFFHLPSFFSFFFFLSSPSFSSFSSFPFLFLFFSFSSMNFTSFFTKLLPCTFRLLPFYSDARHSGVGQQSVRRQRTRLDAGVGSSCGLRSVCPGFARSGGVKALRVSPVGYRAAEGRTLCNGRRQGSFQTAACVSSLLRSLRVRIAAAPISDRFQRDGERASLPSRFARCLV